MSQPVRANYDIVEASRESLTLRDVGPWDIYKTITSAAEEVVGDLVRAGVLKQGMRLFYYDSEGELDELLLDANLELAGFRPGVKPARQS